MKKFKEIRYFSAILSTTVISLNALGAQPTPGPTESQRVWLTCSEGKHNSINCDNTETYQPISNKRKIKALEQELNNKEEHELIVRTVELSFEEIEKYFNFLGSGKPKYLEPKLQFKMLNEKEEFELKSQIKDIQNEIISNKTITADELYNNPKLKLSTIPKKSFDDIINKYRRNNYAIDRDKGGAYIVCGVVGTVAAAKAMDIVGSKMSNKTSSGGGGDRITPIKTDSKNEELLKKIIPIVPMRDKCN